ncbi:MAG TPA: SDR family oxidoreductase [Acidimicrobiales bacterium]|jgi:NAD(P)-dependent dehydrogenase (short-subunit alcohol dehydrogenase family)
MTKGIVPPVLSLEGRRALVTGGGTGIGKACATALAAAGASVTICGPDLAVLEAACGDLARLDLHDVKAITADITDEAQVATAVDAAAMDSGLDIAVANAGVAFPGSLLHIGADHWMGPIGVNVIGTAHTIKHAARAMMEGGGSIITISSIASTRPAAFMSTYSVSKAAVDELTRVAAAELGRFGIRVNGIRPGWMRTETVEATTDEHNLAMIRRDTPLAAETPLGQLGDPDHVARAVVYLAADYSSWITGQLLGVCGGSSLPPPSGDFSHIARLLFAEDMARDFDTSEEE